MKNIKKEVKGVKAFGLIIELKRGWHFDEKEIFIKQSEAKERAKKLGFGHKVIPVLITPIKKVGKK